MTRDHLLVIDQGTTSTRAVVYDNQAQTGRAEPAGSLADLSSVGLGRARSRCDPRLRSSSQVTGALNDAGVTAARIASIGLTNQRETTIVWDRATGKSIAPALVWQDRRTADACAGSQEPTSRNQPNAPAW